MSIRDFLFEYQKRIDSESPRGDTEFIASEFLKKDRSELLVKSIKSLDQKDLDELSKLLERRVRGEPVAYILGYKYFYKYKFLVNSQVLIPRPETEILVEQASDFLKSTQKDEAIILDLGCGSGCLGLSLLVDFPKAKLFAVDFCEKTIDVAKENAKKYSLEDRVCFINKKVQDLTSSNDFNFTQGKLFDLIVANPPYISEFDEQVSKETLEFEPQKALFSKKEGLEYVFDWPLKAQPWLRSGGLFSMEIGFDQGKKVSAYLKDQSLFEQVLVQKDYSGKDRFVFCKNP